MNQNIISNTSTNSLSLVDSEPSIYKLLSFEQDKNVRLYTVNNDPWFSGRDVAAILGYSNVQKAVRSHIDEDDRTSLKDLLRVPELGTLQYTENELNMVYINESGMYSLILRSKLEAAKRFKKWVTSEVLPSIRKQGQYTLSKELENLRASLQQTSLQLQKQEARAIKWSKIVKNLEPPKKDEIFYVATTRLYSTNKRYKIGGVKKSSDLKARLASYNTGRAEGDLFYYVLIQPVYKYTQIENTLGDILKNFKDKQDSRKEMFFISYRFLEETIQMILENRDCEMEKIVQSYELMMTATVEEEHEIIPEPLRLIEDVVIQSRDEDGVNIGEPTVLNVQDWGQEQIQSLLVSIVNSYASHKLPEPYSFYDDKDTVPLTILWKEFIEFIEKTYRGVPRKSWRLFLKNLQSNSSQMNLRVKTQV